MILTIFRPKRVKNGKTRISRSYHGRYRLEGEPKIIKSAKEYTKALARVEELMDAKEGTSQEEELELWALLVERYEEENFPMDIPDPVEAIKFRMEQEGLRQKDLEKYFPGKSRVSEILNHKRSLSIGMIRALHHGLGIPAEVLIREVAA